MLPTSYHHILTHTWILCSHSLFSSSSTMKRSSIDRSNEITFGAAAGRRKPPPPKPKRKVYKTAAWDFVPSEEDELAMNAGDKIEIISTVDEDWGKGRNTRTGETGLYPCNYVE